MLLVTGGSGLLGRCLLERWKEPAAALVHQRPIANCRVIHGDIAKPDLGWSRREHASLLGEITSILHCAALTEFSASTADLRQVNVRGTRNVLGLAQKCPRLEKIGILSTAYVAGRRTGRILEEDLTHDAGFVNNYERSKYHMERVVRMKMSDLPIAVYRISTVLGDSTSGRVEQFNALHCALRLYYRALVPMVPGCVDSRIDLVSSDYVADCIMHLFAQCFVPGRTFHIVSPDADRLPLEQFLETTADIFGRYSPRWRSKALSPPPIVGLETFDTLKRAALQAGNAILREVVSATSLFLPQLCYPKTFDDANLTRDLRRAGIKLRPLLEYYPEIVRRCVETREVMTHRGRQVRV
jgi:thioester reductase-like protein